MVFSLMCLQHTVRIGRVSGNPSHLRPHAMVNVALIMQVTFEASLTVHLLSACHDPPALGTQRVSCRAVTTARCPCEVETQRSSPAVSRCQRCMRAADRPRKKIIASRLHGTSVLLCIGLRLTLAGRHVACLLCLLVLVWRSSVTHKLAA